MKSTLNSLTDPQLKAPELSTSSWFNTSQDPSIEKLKGQVILLHAFQMLCPGCVCHSIPQAKSFAELFAKDDFQMLGIHTVFEHKEVMTPAALEVFLDEYQIHFPVAVDLQREGERIPATMQDYNMRGTPTCVLIDKQGFIRAHTLGQVRDDLLASQIGYLLAE